MFASPQTSASETHPGVLQFANCEFDELRYELRVNGCVVEIERKPLDLLRHLLSKHREVVRKEELLTAVWPGVMVVDASLATAVSKLRRVLGEEEIIQTVPRVGYRIAVPVTRIYRTDPAEESHNANPGTPAAVEADVPPRKKRWQRIATRRSLLWGSIGVSLVITLSIGLIASQRSTRENPQAVNLAILPFQNVSGSESLDYLRSALPDEIAHTLTAARSLTVRPWAASARFTGPGVDFRKVGHDLDVNRVVTGHFLILGDQIHITMEAVDTGEDRILWHDSFDIASNNLLGMQEKMVAVSRGKLADALGVQGFAVNAAPRAKNEEAYELYLKSVAVNWDNKTDKQAIELLRRVVLLDPSYAPAWGMLSLRYYDAARFEGGGPELMALSDAAAEKELALNPDSLDPIAEMTIHRTERGDLVKAHQIALELLRRRPDDPNLHHVLSYVLRYGGSLEEAGRECEIVVLLATKVVWGSCSSTFMELGNYDRSKFFIRKDLSSEWSKAHAIEVLLREGRKADALRIPAPEIPHWDSYKMLLACARGAPSAEIQSLASKVEVDDDPEVDYFFAGHLAYCGQNEAALRMLKVAIDHNYCSYPAMDKDPFFDGLKTNPQFQNLRQTGIECHNDFVSGRDKRQSPSVQHVANKHRHAGSPAGI